MKNSKIILALILVAGLSCFALLPGLATEAPGGRTQHDDGRVSGDKPAVSVASGARGGVPEAMGDTPTYKPPLRGAPGGRIGGGTRGGGEESRYLSALVPDHTGATVQEQPSLYWFLPQTTKYPVEFTIIEAKTQKPLVETRIRQPVQPGVQCVRLADHGVRLKTGVHYQWFVALVPNPDQRSKDIIAGGEIKRVDLQPWVRTKLDRAGKANAPFVYAEAGLWYDALSALADLIATKPDNSLYHRQRASLLRQVGLKEAADYEARQ
jgi:hypothetical protein